MDDQDKRETIDAGTSWGILLVVLLLLIACVSVGAEILLNQRGQQ